MKAKRVLSDNLQREKLNNNPQTTLKLEEDIELYPEQEILASQKWPL